MKVRMTVRLNGTDTNPYEQYGLKCNPFPQIPKQEMTFANHLLADLEARPIKDTDDLRERLKDCSQEFIEGCCQRFHKGKMVQFDIEWPTSRE